jgi:hypothetical protein
VASSRNEQPSRSRHCRHYHLAGADLAPLPARLAGAADASSSPARAHRATRLAADDARHRLALAPQRAVEARNVACLELGILPPQVAQSSSAQRRGNLRRRPSLWHRSYEGVVHLQRRACGDWQGHGGHVQAGLCDRPVLVLLLQTACQGSNMADRCIPRQSSAAETGQQEAGMHGHGIAKIIASK